MIFNLLRLFPTRSEHRDYSAESMLDILEIIIKWLQVGVTNATDKPLTLKIQNFARDLVPSARTTCTIASRVNFFDTKLSVNVDSQGFLNNQIPTLTYLKTFLYHES